jgi:hypothetical protein
MPTLYATFNDAADAERAAGALFDHGIAQCDLTITSKRISHILSNSPLDALAELDGENEGWPPLNTTATAAKQQALKEDQDQADESYREADNAEQSAKSGISLTTPRDVMTGALKGSAVGLGITIIVGLFCMLPTLALGIASIGGPIIVAVVATLGLTAGAMCGASSAC